MNRLSGQGKSEENKRRVRTKSKLADLIALFPHCGACSQASFIVRMTCGAKNLANSPVKEKKYLRFMDTMAFECRWLF